MTAEAAQEVMYGRGGYTKIYECVTPVLRGLQGRGDFVFTELSHCQGGESMVRSVDRSELINALVQICASKNQEVIVSFGGNE